MPAAFAWLVGWSPLGFVAVSVLLAAAIIWLALSMSLWILCLLFVGSVLLLVEPVQTWLLQLISGGSHLQAAAVLAIGLVATLLAGARLVRLNEEMPEYRWIKMNRITGEAEFVGARREPNWFVKDLFSGLSDRQVVAATDHARRAAVSRWSRICRWQIGMVTGWSAVLVALTFVLVFAAVWSMLRLSLPNQKDSFFPIPMLFAFAAFMPLGLSAGSLRLRRGFLLSRESLLCVDRPTYLKQVGAAVAISQLQTWLFSSVGILGLSWLTTGEAFSSRVAFPLLFSALLQPWFFGVAVWCLRLRSPIPFLVAYAVFVPATVFPVISMMAFAPATSGRPVVLALLVAAILAIFGLLLTWHAYRRWLVIDFD